MIFLLVLLLFSLLPALTLLIVHPSFARELWLDLRLERIIHYFVLYLFGFVLYNDRLELLAETPVETLLQTALYAVVLVYSALFAIASNNREDLEIDRITNTNRPLVRKTVDPQLYIRVSRISLVLSLLIAALAGMELLITIAGISLIYFLYSCRPFKLKRYVFLAKFLIGINSLLSAVCGFYVAGGAVSDFPVFWLVFILVPVSLLANFVDLKDTEGDQAAGIRTLPVLYGETFTRYFIAVCALIAYVMVGCYFGSLWIALLLTGTCGVHFYLLFRKPYREKALFLFHNSLFIGLISLVLSSRFISG